MLEGTLREVVRRLARDQWVRTHGTPRITVLAGGDWVRQVWHEWTELMELPAPLLDGDFSAALDRAMAMVTSNPSACVAVLAAPAVIAKWREGRADRKRAMVDEGLVMVPEPPHPVSRPALDARSAAEATLFEALESDRSTTGRFDLNGKLGVRFGASAAEVDLISRTDRIAIELDGFYHFADLAAWRRDRRKDLLLQMQGFVVLRVLAEDVMKDPEPAVLDVKRVLAFRLGEKP